MFTKEQKDVFRGRHNSRKKKKKLGHLYLLYTCCLMGKEIAGML
jgi:hypothetical protein